MEALSKAAGHHIILEDRSELSVSGVQEIVRFDESVIRCVTVKGELEVLGGDLHMEQLSVHSGDILVRGQIDSIAYHTERPKGSWKRRLLGDV